MENAIFASRILRLEKADSTNNVLRQMANGLQSGFTVTAESQTNGKGRSGRHFDSPKGEGIYMSYLYLPSIGIENAVTVTARTAVAVQNALRDFCELDTQIKWVNDLVKNGKKVCGILTETVFDGQSSPKIIIGIGVNVNNGHFPDELVNKATSIYIETGKKFHKEILLDKIITELDKMCMYWETDKNQCLEKYRKSCITLGNEITVIKPDCEKKAFAKSIDDCFGLQVVYENGEEETITSGEVSVRGVYGYV